MHNIVPVRIVPPEVADIYNSQGGCCPAVAATAGGAKEDGMSLQREQEREGKARRRRGRRAPRGRRRRRLERKKKFLKVQRAREELEQQARERRHRRKAARRQRRKRNARARHRADPRTGHEGAEAPGLEGPPVEREQEEARGVRAFQDRPSGDPPDPERQHRGAAVLYSTAAVQYLCTHHTCARIGNIKKRL